VTHARIDVPAETRTPTGKTAAYVVGGEDALLVDPAARTARLDDELAERTAGHVAVTHHHPDHVGGVADCARAHGLTVWARAGRAAGFADATGVEPDRTFAPGTVLPAASGVSVLDTPGHAPEHVGFVTDEAVVSGDLAVAEGSVVVGAPEGDVRAYLTSLRRLLVAAPPRLLPAHGPRIDRPREVCRRLVAHRTERERRVLDAVRAGARTVEAVVDGAYCKELSGVRDLARATVRAHLEKLAVEGRVDWDGVRAAPA
jgi:glyoxylase-like metal-dependent hydrolase (beta-lactamase superfamily II)